MPDLVMFLGERATLLLVAPDSARAL